MPVGNELAKRASNETVLLNWRLWWLSAVFALAGSVLFVAGIWLSIHLEDWGFLGRFGAIISVVGSYLVARPVWRRRFKSRFSTVTLFDGQGFTDAQIAEYVMERVDTWSFYCGFITAAIGTIVWGFADLFNCVSWTAKCVLPTS